MKRRLAHDALLLVGLIVAGSVWYTWTSSPPGEPVDAQAYWLAAGRQDLYVGATSSDPLAYLYSPAFAQLLSPLAGLPLESFLGIWRGLLFVTLALLAGPVLVAAVFFPPVTWELYQANVNLLLAFVAVAGLRWPALWSFALLTKVTPGIGLLWFVVRREWSKLAVALGATAAIALVSIALAPSAWLAWLGVLMGNAGAQPDPLVPLPFLVRFPAAVALIVWGARGNHRWTMPLAAMLALPVFWFASLSMLVGVIPSLMELARRRWPERVRRSLEAAAAA